MTTFSQIIFFYVRKHKVAAKWVKNLIFLLGLVMGVASQGSNLVSTSCSRLSNSRMVLMLVLVMLPIIGAKSGGAGRQGLWGSGTHWRPGQVSVR